MTNIKQKFINDKKLKFQAMINKYKESELNINSELNDVNKELLVLDMSIRGSVDLANSVVDPIKSKQSSINNINLTVEMLNIEIQLKNKLNDLKTSNNKSEKIKIILNANNLISKNHFLFDQYKELFIKESQDVMKDLDDEFNNNYKIINAIINQDNKTNKVIQISETSKIQEDIFELASKNNIVLLEIINNLETTAILEFKLTQDNKLLLKFYDLLAYCLVYPNINRKFNIQSIPNFNIINNLNSDVKNFEVLNKQFDYVMDYTTNIVRNFIFFINKRSLHYYNEFVEDKSNILNEDINLFINMFNLLINKLSCKSYYYIQNKVKYIGKIIDFYENNYSKTKNKLISGNKIKNDNGYNYNKNLESNNISELELNNENNNDETSHELDSICHILIYTISKLIIFKYFCLTTKAKIDYFKNITNNKLTIINNNKLFSFNSNNLKIHKSNSNLEQLSNKVSNVLNSNNSKKVNSSNSISNNNIDNINEILDILKPYENISYELGEKYHKYELSFINYNLLNIFKNDNITFTELDLNMYINNDYLQIISQFLSPIEDFFFILKIACSRAIDTLDLQLCLPIFNYIKEILQEDMIEIIDIKLCSIIPSSVPRSDKYTILNNKSKYSNPTLSHKFNPSNLYFIICLNHITQSLENITTLFENSKQLIKDTFFSCTSSDINNNENNEQENTNNNIIDNKENSPFNQDKIIPDLFNNTIAKNFDIDFKYNYFKSNDYELVNFTFHDVSSLIKIYENYLNKKLNDLFDNYFRNYIKSSTDMLNSVNYNIDNKSLLSAELSDSFANKFIDETDKLLKQWKQQLSELAFNYFISIYCSYVSLYLEQTFMLKRYSNFGVILFEKDVNKIINYFNSLSTTFFVREKFMRVISIIKVLNFDNSEDLLNYMLHDSDISMNMKEVERIRSLKVQ